MLLCCGCGRSNTDWLALYVNVCFQHSYYSNTLLQQLQVLLQRELSKSASSNSDLKALHNSNKRNIGNIRGASSGEADIDLLRKMEPLKGQVRIYIVQQQPQLNCCVCLSVCVSIAVLRLYASIRTHIIALRPLPFTFLHFTSHTCRWIGLPGAAN